MNVPKVRLFYYKNAVNECLRNFFAECGDNCFAKDAAGRYVLTDFPVLARYIKINIPLILRKYVRPFDITKLEYTFVIGGCAPSDNMLLEYRTKYFPKKLDAALKSGCPRYVLKERDIIVDMAEFDRITDSVFVSAFSGGFPAVIGTDYKNVFAIRHRRLDCYAVFKALKYVYGRQNCVNVWKEEMTGHRQCITAVNDLIDLYVNNKAEMNKSKEFKMTVEEMKQYADGCIRGCCNG